MKNLKHIPISFYSKPLFTYETKLAQMFQMPVRKKAEKPNRSMVITWNAKHPLVPHFTNNYSYYVSFYKKNAAAGNHYHMVKQEIIFPIIGSVKLLLENVKTKEKEEHVLKSPKHYAVYVPTYIAHTVVAQTTRAVIIVTASTQSSEEDEISYQLA